MECVNIKSFGNDLANYVPICTRKSLTSTDDEGTDIRDLILLVCNPGVLYAIA